MSKSTPDPGSSDLAAVGRVEEAVEQLKSAFVTVAERSPGPNRGPTHARPPRPGISVRWTSKLSRSWPRLLVSLGYVSSAGEAFGHANELLDSFPDGGPDRMWAGLRSLAEKARPARSRVR